MPTAILKVGLAWPLSLGLLISIFFPISGQLTRCEFLPAPANGYLKGRCGPNASVGATCSAGCKPGFTLTDTNPLVCQSNGLWSGNVPQCIRALPDLTPVVFPVTTPIYCPSLNRPEGGSFNGACSPGVPGYTCNFSCTSPNILIGQTSVYCNNDGNWIGNLPYCQAPIGYWWIRPRRPLG